MFDENMIRFVTEEERFFEVQQEDEIDCSNRELMCGDDIGFMTDLKMVELEIN